MRPSIARSRSRTNRVLRSFARSRCRRRSLARGLRARMLSSHSTRANSSEQSRRIQLRGPKSFVISFAAILARASRRNVRTLSLSALCGAHRVRPGAARRACALCRAALDAAKSSDEPACCAVAAIALAESEPQIRNEMAAQHRRGRSGPILRRCATPSTHIVVVRVTSGCWSRSCSAFGTSRRFAVRATVRRRIAILTGDVTVGLSAIRLSGRERELFFYLALAQRPCSRAELLDAIWPESARTHTVGAARLPESNPRAHERPGDHLAF